MVGKPRLAVVWLIAGVGLGLCLSPLLRNKQQPAPAAAPAMSEEAVPAAAVEDTRQLAAEEPSIPGLARLRQILTAPGALDLAACLTLIKQLSVKECAEAVALFDRMPTEDRRVVQRALARRWAALDPPGLLETAQQFREADKQRIFSDEAARVLVERDPDAALAMLSQKASPWQRAMLARPILFTLAARDPARAAAFVTGRPGFALDENIYGAIARQWAVSDPRQALVWATALPSGRGRSEAIKALGASWAQHDPAAVAGEISHARDKWGREVVNAVAQSWSAIDPRAAIAWIKTLPLKADQDSAWSNLRLDARQLGVDATLDILKTVPSEKYRAEIAAQTASVLAREDRRAALAFAEKLPEGAQRDQALRPVLDKWATKDPAEAVGYVASLPPGQGRTELLRRNVATWAVQDGDAAMAWARQLPAGRERDEVMSNTALGLRELDPATAAEWAQLTENVDTRRNLIREVARVWAQIDGPAAAQWLSQMPDPEAQVEGHYSVARQWAFNDMEGAANWISTLPAGTARDAAIRAFVMTVDGYDAGLATTWAAAIQEPQQRYDTIGSAFKRWLESDSAAAQAWLARAPIEENLRAALVQTMQTRKR